MNFGLRLGQNFQQCLKWPKNISAILYWVFMRRGAPSHFPEHWSENPEAAQLPMLPKFSWDLTCFCF